MTEVPPPPKKKRKRTYYFSKSETLKTPSHDMIQGFKTSRGGGGGGGGTTPVIIFIVWRSIGTKFRFVQLCHEFNEKTMIRLITSTLVSCNYVICPVSKSIFWPPFIFREIKQKFGEDQTLISYFMSILLDLCSIKVLSWWHSRWYIDKRWCKSQKV